MADKLSSEASKLHMLIANSGVPLAHAWQVARGISKSAEDANATDRRAIVKLVAEMYGLKIEKLSPR